MFYLSKINKDLLICLIGIVILSVTFIRVEQFTFKPKSEINENVEGIKNEQIKTADKIFISFPDVRLTNCDNIYPMHRGFPLTFYSSIPYNHGETESINILNLVANLLIASLTSVIAVMLIRFLANTLKNFVASYKKLLKSK